ncbi:MAG: DNA phosphorothioation-associated putative methyltransferase [Verrucomicrobiota bacterium]
MDLLLAGIAEQCGVSKEFNLVKFRTDELKVSFLAYPDFLLDAHPSLRHAITVDLVKGKARHMNYADNINPPILHRKETFLPAGHPLRAQFEALTRAEEAAGLYEKTATIGFKLNWEKLLASKGLVIRGHTLEQAEGASLKAETGDQESGKQKLEMGAVVIERHKTALTRYELSKPVKSLLEYGLLRPGTTFFDYGCGQGADFRGLHGLGYEAEGWDPVFRRDVGKREADIVNFGYVLNVIEDPAERVETLVDAFRHARRLLVVSGLINETVDTNTARRFGDGVLTRSNTFQKFFEQQELQQYIEDALETTAVPVALGVFYVFRDPAEQQDFLSARSRRTIDWTQISARLGLGGPKMLWRALYEQHKEVLDAFGKLALELGRMPEPTEFAGLGKVSELLGSAKRGLRAYVQGGGAGGVDWDAIKVQFRVGQPARRRWEILCEENRELLGGYWQVLLQLGRLPEPEEFPRFADLREKVGSGNRALRLFVLRGGGEEIRKAAEGRKRDLLVYVALANLRKRVPFGHLSQSLRWDVRAFFGNYTRALEKGLELLYAAGDTGEIELACEGLGVGWQDEQALYIHRSLLNELPPVLRAYVGCATSLFGDVAQADVIKLHKASGKVTFLVYDDFEGKPLPELRQRIKVNLRTRWVQVFDHSAAGQLLYFKERFVSASHPARASMERFSEKLRKLGAVGDGCTGPNKVDLLSLLDAHRLNENLNKRRGDRGVENGASIPV